MKLQVLGVKRIEGNAKASGNPFDMCRLIAVVPVDVGGGGSVKVTGYGFEVAEVNLDPEALPQFSKLKYPCVLELDTDSRPFRGKLESIVVGIVAAAVVAPVRAAG